MVVGGEVARGVVGEAGAVDGGVLVVVVIDGVGLCAAGTQIYGLSVAKVIHGKDLISVIDIGRHGEPVKVIIFILIIRAILAVVKRFGGISWGESCRGGRGISNSQFKT